jgi:NAD(P)-dependent dehydrogenase (short-subunit alcohol dehydrogenase family)
MSEPGETRKQSAVAWITGGGSGIGRALALGLARRGWRVVISGRTTEKLDAVVREAAGGAGEVIARRADVTDRAALDATLSALERELGPVQLCILNAGTYRPLPADELDVELFRETVEVNLLGVVNALGAVLPGMRRRGRGQVLVMGSVVGYRGLPSAAAYGATKAALINMTESLHRPLGREGVRLRIVNPGFVRTPLTDQNRFAMPFLLEPDDAAERILRRLDGRSFEIAFPWAFVALLMLMRCLPYRLFFPLIAKVTGR